MPAETGYSSIERELLSVVFCLERLNHYVFGSTIKGHTDHKSPIPIWKKSIAVANPELQCLLLRLAKYDVELTYLKGKDNVIADAFNKVSPLEPESEDRDNFGTIQVYHITSEVPASGSQPEAVRVVTQ